jgi:hypothetical protein
MTTFRWNELMTQTVLEISDWGDSAIYLLNPQVVTVDGEWEAWFYAPWNIVPARYRSFWDLMQAEFGMASVTFMQMQQPTPSAYTLSTRRGLFGRFGSRLPTICSWLWLNGSPCHCLAKHHQFRFLGIAVEQCC